MITKKRTQLVHGGKYLVAVDVRNALREGDLKVAAKFGRVYRLTPVAG